MSLRKKFAATAAILFGLLSAVSPAAYATHYRLQVNSITYDSQTWGDGCRMEIHSGSYLTAAFANVSGKNCWNYKVKIRYSHNGVRTWTEYSTETRSNGEVAQMAGPANSVIECVRVKALDLRTDSDLSHLYCK